MLVFIIPVKSKKITSDWNYFSNLLNRCLHSICKQTNTNYKVLVACHEIPETDFNNDSRVEFLQVDFEPPKLKNDHRDLFLKRIDKTKKVMLAAEHAIKLGAPYVMTVDSDDCISNRICDFVQKNKDDSVLGWYIKKGYLYPEGKPYAYLNLKNFNEICGSCVIMKPEFLYLMNDKEYFFKHERTNFTVGTLKPLPFPGAVYSMLNGTNIRLNTKEMKKRTEFKVRKSNSFTTLFRRLAKYRPVPSTFIKREFGVYKVDLERNSDLEVCP